MKVVIEFSESPVWSGVVRSESEPSKQVFRYTMEPGRVPKPWNPEGPDPHGLKRAANHHLAVTFKSAFGPQISATTFEEFKREFLKRVQGLMLDHAALGMEWILPANFVEEIWTPDLVRALADKLKRPAPKRAEMRRLRETLAAGWPVLFNQASRSELVECVNELLKTNYSEKKVWDTAYEMGLVSKNPPGPRPRR